MTIQVLIIEDDAIAAEAHATYVERLPAFEVVAVARTVQQAIRAIETVPIDLILLDLHLPDGHGLHLLGQIRASAHHLDVIAVTSARDLEVVRQAISQGVFAYILKPFTFAGFKLKLEQYASYLEQFNDKSHAQGQRDVDEMLNTLRPASVNENLPKGMSTETLDDVVRTLTATDSAYSATEMAAEIGSSRVTARRYLEYLAEIGTARRATRYGKTGRPQVEYRPK